MSLTRIAVCLLCAPALAHAQAAVVGGDLDPAAEAWVQRTLAAMTPEQRVGQLLMPAVAAGTTASNEQGAELLRLVEDLGIGSVTLRVRSGRDAIELINALQTASATPLLINVNFERGTGTFWPEGTLFPRQMALAATGDPETARAVGAITARESRACGVHWVSVPICDVSINPGNPIINIRSYGEDVATVSRFAVAFIEGCQDGGVLACAKHFPGHGDTATDSHLELPFVEQDRARLEAVEFPPFRAAIDAGVATVMTSHIHFPALMGAEGPIPATLSRRVLTGLLREEMGFRGLVITDAMTMRGITDHWAPGEAAVAAVAAGADVILDSPDFRAVHAAILEAIRSGTLPEQRIAESAERILSAKAALGLHRRTFVDVGQALAALARPDAIATATEIARRAVTVVKDDDALLPLVSPEETALLHIALCDDWPGWDFADVHALAAGLRTRFGQVSSEIAFENPEASIVRRYEGAEEPRTAEEVRALFGLPDERRRMLLDKAHSADVTLVTASVRTASHRARIGLGERQVALIRDLAAGDRPLILAILGSPYLATATPEVPCIVLTFDDSRASVDALAGALAGEFAITGRLPVTLPGLAERGQGLQIPAR